MGIPQNPKALNLSLVAPLQNFATPNPSHEEEGSLKQEMKLRVGSVIQRHNFAQKPPFLQQKSKNYRKMIKYKTHEGTINS